MAFKKCRRKHDKVPSCPHKNIRRKDNELPPKAEILHMTLGYTMRFPITIPVTMSTLCCMPPGAAKVDFNGHFFNKIVAVGVVCWNMRFSSHVEYYLYDPNDKSETYLNVIQCPFFDGKDPHCYPMGTYVAAKGYIVGTTGSTLMMGNVKPITERQYNEHVFQARMAKFQCVVDVVPKPLLRDADLFKVSTNFTVEQVRMKITAKLLAECPYMAIVWAYPVKFKDTSDSVFKYFRLCGEKLRKPVWPLQNGQSAKSNGTPKPANTNEASIRRILNKANATVFSVPYKHIKACKATTPNIDKYAKLVDYFRNVDIMKLILGVCFYCNHAPVTVAMLNALPEKDRFKWGGLTFKTVRVIGKVVSKTIDREEIHYVLEDLQLSAQYSVLQYISEGMMAPITYDEGEFVEVVGDLHAKTKKRNHDAVIADHVRRVNEKCPFVQKFIDNAAFVCEYDDEAVQIVLLAMSLTDYCRYGRPPGKVPLSVTCDLIIKFDFEIVIPVDESGVFEFISPESCLWGMFERLRWDGEYYFY